MKFMIRACVVKTDPLIGPWDAHTEAELENKINWRSTVNPAAFEILTKEPLQTFSKWFFMDKQGNRKMGIAHSLDRHVIEPNGPNCQIRKVSQKRTFNDQSPGKKIEYNFFRPLFINNFVYRYKWWKDKYFNCPSHEWDFYLGGASV